MTLYAENGFTEPVGEARAAGKGPLASDAGAGRSARDLPPVERAEEFPSRRVPRSGGAGAERPAPGDVPPPADPLSWVEQLRPAGANRPAARRRPSPLGRVAPVLEALADLSFTEVAVARFARPLFLAGCVAALLGWVVTTVWAFSVGPAVGIAVLLAVGAAATLALLLWRGVLELATLGVRLSEQLGALQKRAVFERRVFRDH